MSIADKLSRLSDARDDIITALGNKGVIATGHGFEDFPTDIANIVSGSGSAVVVTDTADSHGGTIREITAVSLAGDTVTAATLQQGYTAHNALGEPITGELVPGGGSVTLQTKTETYTPTTSQQTDTITPDTGYDGLDEVDITINAVPTGSVTAPSSISGSSATVSTSGTNTLTLTKSVSVTPNVTTAGYISSGTAGNSSVSLSASVNIRSSSSLSASGDTVTVPAGYYASQATKAVSAGTAGTPTATKGTVSNHSVSVTPSVTNTSGYITGSTKTGTAVTVSASELVSGSETKTENGTYDVTNLAELVVNVSGGGGTSKNVQVVQGTTRTNSSTLTAIGSELTVSKTGTYDIYWSGLRTNTSSSYTWGTRLYIGGTAYGTENTTWTNNQQNNHLSNVSLTANQTVRVYGRETRGSSYYVCAPMLLIIEK